MYMKSLYNHILSYNYQPLTRKNWNASSTLLTIMCCQRWLQDWEMQQSILWRYDLLRMLRRCYEISLFLNIELESSGRTTWNRAAADDSVSILTQCVWEAKKKRRGRRKESGDGGFEGCRHSKVCLHAWHSFQVQTSLATRCPMSSQQRTSGGLS